MARIDRLGEGLSFGEHVNDGDRNCQSESRLAGSRCNRPGVFVHGRISNRRRAINQPITFHLNNTYGHRPRGDDEA